MIVTIGTALPTCLGYTFLATNAAGCDSTATLNLTINNATTSSTDVTACDSTIGTALPTLLVECIRSWLLMLHCDSTATLNLTINNATIHQLM